MSRRSRLVLFAGSALFAAAAPWWAPPLLARVPWFAVDRVEISGTHLLAPHQVLAASGIRSGHNLWDSEERIESDLRRHPAIASATVSRRFPNTMRIRVEEKQPIAYVETGVLAPITARGELLPVDPARARVDLPVIRATWSRTPTRLRRRLLAETERLGRVDPALLANVSEIRAASEDSDVLILSHALAEIVIPVGAGPVRLAQLRAVLGELERRLPPPDRSGAAANAARVDLRFGEQIVVRLPSSV